MCSAWSRHLEMIEEEGEAMFFPVKQQVLFWGLVKRNQTIAGSTDELRRLC